jgi:hypothetical protein
MQLLAGGGDERIDYDAHRKVLSVAGRDRWWYLGRYDDGDQAEQCGRNFIRKLDNERTNTEALSTVANGLVDSARYILEKAETFPSLGATMRNDRESIYIRFKYCGSNIMLGAFSQGSGPLAHRVLDAFFTTAVAGDLQSIEAGVGLAKLVKATGTLHGSIFHESVSATFNRGVAGYNAITKELRYHIGGNCYYLGRFASADEARPIAFKWKRSAHSIEPTDGDALKSLELECRQLGHNAMEFGAEVQPSSSSKTDNSSEFGEESSTALPSVQSSSSGLRETGLEDTKLQDDAAAALLHVVETGLPGAILGYRMGLGKTHICWKMISNVWLAKLPTGGLGSGAHQPLLQHNEHILIVVQPKHLDFWLEECQQWTPSLWGCAVINTDAFSIAPTSPRIHLLSYVSFWDCAIMDRLSKCRLRYAIFDEARGFDDPTTRTSTNIRALQMLNSVDSAQRLCAPVPRNSPRGLFLLAVHGTPAGTSVHNLCHLLQLLGFAEVEPSVASIRRCLLGEEAPACGGPAVPGCLIRANVPLPWKIEMTLELVEATAAQRTAIHRQFAQLADYATSYSCAPAVRSILNFEGADEAARQLWACPWGHLKLNLQQLLQGSGKLLRLHMLLKQFIPQGWQLLVFTNHHSSRRLLDTYFNILVGDDEGRNNLDGDLLGSDFSTEGLLDLLASPLGSITSLDGDDCTSAAKLALDNLASGITRVLHLSTESGGRGHNAPAADGVIFFDGCRSARAGEQCVFRALRCGRDPARALHVWDLVVADSFEHGERTARWARAALADILLPSWFDPQAAWMGSGHNGRSIEKRAIALLERGSLGVAGALSQLSQEACLGAAGLPRRQTSKRLTDGGFTPASAKREAWLRLERVCTPEATRMRKKNLAELRAAWVRELESEAQSESGAHRRSSPSPTLTLTDAHPHRRSPSPTPTLADAHPHRRSFSPTLALTDAPVPTAWGLAYALTSAHRLATLSHTATPDRNVVVSPVWSRPACCSRCGSARRLFFSGAARANHFFSAGL